MTHVVITDCDHGTVDRELAILQPRHGVTVAGCRTEDDVLRATAGADAIICQYAPITDRVLARLPRCRVIARYGVGYDNIDVEAATRRRIWVANVPDYGVEEVAHHALALSLTLLRGVDRLARRVRSDEWDYRPVRPLRRISTLTVGVVGHGRIGATYARAMASLGARVMVSDVREVGVPRVPLPELLAQADLVSLHVPAGRTAPPLIGRAELAAMRPGAYLVNTARGALVDQTALLAAVDSGALAGAALDVLADEPPADARLCAHDRIVVTPHSAWYSEEAFAMLKDEVALEVVRVLSGEPPRNPIAGIRTEAQRG